MSATHTTTDARYLVIDEDGNVGSLVPLTLEQAERRAKFYRNRAHDFTPYGVSRREAIGRVRIEQIQEATTA